MFGRRKHRAQPATPVIETTGSTIDRTQLEQAVRTVINEQIGVNGRWVLQRRDDTVDVSDTIFQDGSCASLSRAIIDAIFNEETERPAGTSPVVPSERRDAREQRDYIERELTSIAVWADPERHDPAVISDRIVTPSTSDAVTRNTSAS